MNYSEQTEVRKIGNRHPITVRLIAALKKGAPGDKFFDDDLNKIATVDITDIANKHYLYSAIKYLERAGLVWRRVPKTGMILCLSDAEKTECCGQAVRHIRKTARRHSRILSSVKPNNLPKDKRPTAMALSAQLGAISLFAKRDTTLKITGEQTVPKLCDIMKIFK